MMFSRIRSSPLWPMLWKELVQMRRDRFTLGMLVGIPAIQLLLFGFAIRMEVRHLPAVVLDESKTTESRALTQAMINTGNFDLAGRVSDRDEMRRIIERGDARAAVVIPPDFETDLKRRRTATAQVIIDAADPLASQAAISAAALASAARNAALAPPNAGGAKLEIRVRPWYNPALESSIYIVPGVAGLILTLTLSAITSMSIVRERERGTLEQLIVTPVTRAGLMLGKILPFALVGYIQITVILLLGRFVFHVPVRGSILLLYASTAPFIMASLALGLFISTAVKTQIQAMQLSFLVILPSVLLSGFMFPREAMPTAAQWIGGAIPLTYFLRILRGVLLKGTGIAAIWKDVLSLCVFALVLVTLSATRFRKSLD
jgi:ABC-2 type transport system permease protein